MTCTWRDHQFGLWVAARVGMLSRTCMRCGVLQHAPDRNSTVRAAARKPK